MIYLHRFLQLVFVLTIITCLAWLFGVHEAAAVKPAPLQVTVSILPQEYFVKRIGGQRVQVTTLVQPGNSPATYAPTPKQMASIASAHIYFRIGVPFENSLYPKLKRSLPDLMIIDLQEGIKLMPMEEGPDDIHDHHEDLDPHTWLDPNLALHQSLLIRDALIRFDPAGETKYRNNFAALERDLEQLDKELQGSLLPLAGKTIYVFHPAYGYFCRAYGLHQKAVHPEGKNPGAKYLARLIEQAKKDNVKAIFVQPQFSTKAARTLARSIGGSVITLDPLALNYLDNMRSISKQLVRSYINQPH